LQQSDALPNLVDKNRAMIHYSLIFTAIPNNSITATHDTDTKVGH